MGAITTQRSDPIRIAARTKENLQSEKNAIDETEKLESMMTNTFADSIPSF